MSGETIGLFLVSAMAAAIAPGPDNLTVITRSVSQGTVAGLVATMGFASGVAYHTAVVVVVIGLSLKALQSPAALRVVQLAGVAYLLYLAARMIMAKDPLAVDADKVDRRSLWRIYGQSALMNMLNPKVTLFFLGFLPLFVEKNSNVPATLQLVLFGAMFAGSTIVVFGACAVMAGKLTESIRARPGAGRPLRIVTALFFIAISLWLAFWHVA